jgi:uncharacterized membrane protein HdeD (DUF308 family)
MVDRHARDGRGFGFGLMAALGLLLVVAGVVGLFYVGFATITTMVLFGVLLLVGGAIGLVQAVQVRGETGAWLVVAVAALDIAAGVILVAKPHVAAAALTLFVALLLLAAGLFRVVGAIVSLSARMVWTLLVGLVDIALGLLVLAEWPSSSRYAIGGFVSLALLVDGIGLLTLGVTGRRIVGMVREAEAPPPAAGKGPDEIGGPARWHAGEEGAERARKGRRGTDGP